MADSITSKTALKKLDSQLECSICFDTFNQPKLLPCFHVFCKSPCLERLVARDGRSLTCPTCRHIVPLSEKGVDGLQSDFHFDRLFEIREAFNKVAESSTETECGSCEEGKATGYCRDCEEFICDECQAAHKKIKKLKEHTFLTMEELQTQSTAFIQPKTTVAKCSKHPENSLRIFCETCSIPICTDCTIRLHKDHSYDLADEIFQKHKDEIVSSLAPVKVKLEVAQQALKVIETRAKEINDKKAMVEAHIYKEIEQQHQLLDQRKVQLLGELDMLTQQKLKTLATQKDQVEITQIKLASCVEYAEGGLQTGTQDEILAMKAPVIKRIEQLSTTLCQDILQPNADADMELIVETKQQFETACNELFEIAEVNAFYVENSQTTDIQKNLTSGEQKTVVFHAKTRQNKEYKGKLNLKAELEHIKSKDRVQCEVVNQQNGQYKISYQSVKRGKHELHITVNGYPVRGSPFPIGVTPSAQSFSKPVRIVHGFDRPRNATFNSKRQMIIVQGNGTCVSILTPEGETLRTFGTGGSGFGQFKDAYGVAVDRDDNIYVVGCGNHRVQKFDPKGKFVVAVGGYGSNPLQFYCPVGICYNHADNYMYVADQCNHRLQVLTTELEFVRSFGTKGSGGGQFNLPFNIAFDDTNRLYVTDHYNDRVQVLTTEGQFIRVFSQKPNSKKLYHPWAIAIDSCNIVYVSEDGPHKVSVFTSQGTGITSLGKKGSEEGQFCNVNGLVVDENDAVIASDMNNQRLQIY